MDRIYHTWDKWECYPAGFFESKPKDNPKMSEGECKYLYAQFLRDIPRFKMAMAGVLKDWPHSCEQWLSNERMNRIAWLGQAAMCYATGIPSTFCGGFNQLTAEEQHAANLAALQYLNIWLEARGEPTLATLKDAERKTQPEMY
jgi:hypothetical protein